MTFELNSQKPKSTEATIQHLLKSTNLLNTLIHKGK